MICTWYNKEERDKLKTTSDKDINDLLKEVNTAFEDKYFIREHFNVQKKLFKRPQTIKTYTLYCHLCYDEVMCINFCQDWDWSINVQVGRSCIITYLLGIMSGYQQTKEKTN